MASRFAENTIDMENTVELRNTDNVDADEEKFSIRFHLSKKAGWVLAILIVVFSLFAVAPAYYQYYEVSRRHVDVMNATVIGGQINEYMGNSENDLSLVPEDTLMEVNTLKEGIVTASLAITNLKQKNAVYYFLYDSTEKKSEIYIGKSGLSDIDDMASGDLMENKYLIYYWNGLSKDGKNFLNRI